MLISQKHLFTIDESIHYLNCAYMAPILKEAELVSQNAIKKQRNPHTFFPNDFFNTTSEIKNEFSKIIASHPQEIAIMPSTSYGFASALNNIKSNRKKAITIGNEFPSGYFALQKWSTINQNKLMVIKQDDLSPSEWNNKIIESIDENTSVVLLSSVHWMNGIKLNLKEIGEKCKKNGVFFIVDGTQSVGAIPINVKKLQIDVLICAAYKWLFGPYSMALGYFSEKFNNGSPIEESWMNRSNAKNFSSLTDYESNYMPSANRYNVGQTSNFILSPIMLSGLKQLNKWGIENISEYCNNLYSYLKELCESKDVKFGDSIDTSNHLFSLGFSKDVDSKKMKEKLEQNNIFVSLRGDYIRVSLNVFNEKKDIEKLAHVLS